MSIAKLTPFEKEHAEAQAEHQMWWDDLGRWRTEHRRAGAMLAQVQTALLDHDAALESHAETIRRHELEVERHELALTDQGRGGSGSDVDNLAASHREQQETHDRQRNAHRRIKAYHERVTTEIETLIAKLHSAM